MPNRPLGGRVALLGAACLVSVLVPGCCCCLPIPGPAEDEPVVVPIPVPVQVAAPEAPNQQQKTPMAWGNKVTPAFANRVREIGSNLEIDPSWLMSVIAFESGETFSSSVKNAAGSGAVGLIQFMPNTAASLGTTTAALAKMTAIQQLDYVERYFAPYKGKLTSVDDAYMVVLYPKAVGKAGSYELFHTGTMAYSQNAGLDANRDGSITKAEAAAQVRAKLVKGSLPGWSR